MKIGQIGFAFVIIGLLVSLLGSFFVLTIAIFNPVMFVNVPTEHLYFAMYLGFGFAIVGICFMFIETVIDDVKKWRDKRRVNKIFEQL